MKNPTAEQQKGKKMHVTIHFINGDTLGMTCDKIERGGRSIVLYEVIEPEENSVDPLAKRNVIAEFWGVAGYTLEDE